MEKPLVITVVSLVFISIVWAQLINMRSVKSKQLTSLSQTINHSKI